MVGSVDADAAMVVGSSKVSLFQRFLATELAAAIVVVLLIR